MFEVGNAMFSWFIVMREHDASMIDDLLKATTKKFYSMSQRDPSHKELQFSCAKVY